MRRHFINSLILTASALAVELILAAPAMAGTPTLPSGGTFVARDGSGTISTSGSTETVHVAVTGGSTGPAVINWNSYDVGAGGTISYVPASGGPTSGVIVNVDNSGSVSTIDGTISSPDYAQVIVNPNGISVGSTASLPAQTELAAGTYNDSAGVPGYPVTITADTAPVTIASGATFAPAGSTPAAVKAGVATMASSGDTLPDSIGLTTDILVPANKASSFTLQPGQTGFYDFFGPPSGIDYTTNSVIPTAPSSVSITGPAGGTVGSLNINEPFQSTSLPTGTLSVSNVTSSGSLFFMTGQALTLSGTVMASGDLTAEALPETAGSGASASLTIASGSDIGCGASSCAANLQATDDYVGQNVTLDGYGASLQAVSTITSSGSSAGSITDNETGSGLDITAPSISNLSITATGSNALATLSSNAVSDVSVAGPAVTFAPAPYERTAPDYQPMSLDNVTVSTGGLSVQAAYGVTMNSFTQTLPSGTPNGYVSIAGVIPGIGYQPSTNASNAVSISNSAFNVGPGGSIDVAAGIVSGSTGSTPIPGAVTITGSTMKSGGGTVSVSAYDAGTIDIGSGSTLTADEAGACDGSYAACTTAILAQTVDFKSGNTERASGGDLISAGSTTTGTANATPSELNVHGLSSSSANVTLDAAGGTATVDGTLDAGTPSPGSTSPSTGTGGSTPPATGGTSTGSTSPSTGTGTTVPPSTPTPPPVVVTVPPVVTTTSAPKPASAAPAPSKPTAPSVPIVTIAPVTIEPSATVSTVEQHGSTVLVPEGSNGPDRPRVDLGDAATVTAQAGVPVRAPAPAPSRPQPARRQIRQAVPHPVAPRPAPRPVVTHKPSPVRRAVMTTTAMTAPGFSIGAPAPAAPPAMTTPGFSLAAEIVVGGR